MSNLDSLIRSRLFRSTTQDGEIERGSITPVRGRLAGQNDTVPVERRDCHRRLVAAILLQALLDAWAGNCEASYWLDHFGLHFAAWLGLSRERFATWRDCCWPVPTPGDPDEFADLVRAESTPES
jgi:hypothetical protein